MIRVRATKDGTYAGYVWYGPSESDQGTVPGDIFDIDATPFQVKDERGRPVQEMEPTGQVDANGQKTYRLAWVMENGKVKKDEYGQPIPKIKMATFFSLNWMERVPDDAELSFPDRDIPFKIPEPYRVKKQTKPTKAIALPSEIAAIAGMESPL